MSKERLEEIIKSLEDKAVIDRSDYEWLIEQAERLQELKKRYLILTKENNQVNDELIDEFRKNKRYREALEFYANKINYLTFIKNGKSNIEHDQGEKAREALEGDLG